MYLATAVQLADIVAPLAAVGSILFAVRAYRRQMNAQLFVAFTERYEEIMSAFLPEVRTVRAGAPMVLPAQSQALTLAVLRYLNLCAEEFYLYRTGHLSRKLWGIWEDEMRRSVASEVIKREWVALKDEFQSFPEFAAYVDGAQSASNAVSVVTS